MKTHTLDTEIVYYLSPTKSISDSLKQFGVGEDDKDLAAIIVVISQDKENDNFVRQEIENKKCALKNIICGTLEEVRNNNRKYFQLTYLHCLLLS